MPPRLDEGDCGPVHRTFCQAPYYGSATTEIQFMAISATSIDTDFKRSLLDSIALFRGVNPDDISDLLSACGRTDIEQGRTLLSPKIENQCVYVVLSGELAVHIGSQLTTLDPFREAFTRVAGMVTTLRAAGHSITQLDLGGGLGIVYDGEVPPEPEDYAAVVAETVGDLGVDLTFEPGRVLVGNAGILVTSVIQVKETATKRFVVVDAAMNDFIRPTLYDAVHAAAPVNENPGSDTQNAEIVGPVCETGDILASNVQLPVLAENDLLFLKSAGAYGAVMASSYNTRLPIPEIMVNHAEFSVIRPRPSFDELLSLDRMPDWL